jgi:hypothetical protein
MALSPTWEGAEDGPRLSCHTLHMPGLLPRAQLTAWGRRGWGEDPKENWDSCEVGPGSLLFLCVTELHVLLLSLRAAPRSHADPRTF